MESKASLPPSFSASQRWGIFLSVIVSILTACALVVMINYLASKYFKRFIWSRDADTALSAQTLSLLKTITNKVDVIIYFDRKDNLYTPVDSLLQEYHLANPKISLDHVDFLVDAARAQKIQAQFKFAPGEDKNLIIFECEGRHKIIQASQLADYAMEAVQSSVTNEFVRHLQAFEGEKYFSSALLTVTSPKPRRVYFLEGHGEHNFENGDGDGYKKFAAVLAGQNIAMASLNLVGTNLIPANCNLLIIPGPRRVIPADELEKIRRYLSEGGRMLVLFNYATVANQILTGLEPLLAEWNFKVGMNIINDPGNTQLDGAIKIQHIRNHPLVNGLADGSGLALFNPRSVEILQADKPSPEAPVGDELVFTSENPTVGANAIPVGRRVSLMAAVEKGRVKGVLPERGTTAIVVVGDSTFLDNKNIEEADNLDFAGLAVGWLMDPTQLLQGVGPHPVKEYKVNLTDAQFNSIRWIFLAAIPGGILLLGGAVWLRRRH
jgi:hypothetical protein